MSSPLDVIRALDQLEAVVLAVRIHVWHLVVWTKSPVRPLAARLAGVYPIALRLIEGYREARALQIGAAQTAGHHQVLPSQLAILTDSETALSSRIERVRFLITSKEGEEHAKRSVMLGVGGFILGALSLVPVLRGLFR